MPLTSSDFIEGESPRGELEEDFLPDLRERLNLYLEDAQARTGEQDDLLEARREWVLYRAKSKKANLIAGTPERVALEYGAEAGGTIQADQQWRAERMQQQADQHRAAFEQRVATKDANENEVPDALDPVYIL